MSDPVLRGGLLSPLLIAGFGAAAFAQSAKLQGFPSADAAASAFTEAVRKSDVGALRAMLGESWVNSVVDERNDPSGHRRNYLAAWDAKHAVNVQGDRATLAVGNDGWTLPIPIVKDGAEWRFDVVAAERVVLARQIGHDEYGAIQSLLAIVDAQYEYVALDPTRSGWSQYARRLKSSPGKKDGLYWPTAAGEKPSPLGEAFAESQFDGKVPGGHFGYNFRLLYAQGPAAEGGAHDYLVDGRLLGGFGAIATPLLYGETGVMTFIVNYKGVVYQQDLGPDTAQRAGAIAAFNPDQGWKKADLTPP